MESMIFWTADTEIKVNMIFSGCSFYYEDHVHFTKVINTGQSYRLLLEKKGNNARYKLRSMFSLR